MRKLILCAVLTSAVLTGCTGDKTTDQPTPSPTVAIEDYEGPAVTLPQTAGDGYADDSAVPDDMEEGVIQFDDDTNDPEINGTGTANDSGNNGTGANGTGTTDSGMNNTGTTTNSLLENNVRNAAEKQSGVDKASVTVSSGRNIRVTLDMREGETLSDTARSSIEDAAGGDYNVEIIQNTVKS